MRPVQIPPTVPGDDWPILSAVRYGTTDTPAEFIVVVDCGEGTPTQPYATLHVYVWPDRIKFRDGEYNLTFPQAQRSMMQRARLTYPIHVNGSVLVWRDASGHSERAAVFVNGRVDDTDQPTRITVHVVDLDREVPDAAPIQALQQTWTLPATASRMRWPRSPNSPPSTAWRCTLNSVQTLAPSPLLHRGW